MDLINLHVIGGYQKEFLRLKSSLHRSCKDSYFDFQVFLDNSIKNFIEANKHFEIDFSKQFS